MGEGLEAVHAVEVDEAVEVVGLVLDDAGGEALVDPLERLAVEAVAAELELAVAAHLAAQVGHREAALPAVLQLLGQRRHHRVDQHGERDRGGVGIARVAVDLDHANLLELVHLGGREPRAVVLAHGLDHVVDQALDLGRPDLRDRNRRRDLAKHGMS